MAFKKGQIPWNKGQKGLQVAWNKGLKRWWSSPTEFKKGQNTGSENYNWKEEGVSYIGLHQWVRRGLGKPVECVYCGSDYYLEWANIDGQYKRNLIDWIPLCKKCHNIYDDVYTKMRITRGTFV